MGDRSILYYGISIFNTILDDFIFQPLKNVRIIIQKINDFLFKERNNTDTPDTVARCTLHSHWHRYEEHIYIFF